MKKILIAITINFLLLSCSERDDLHPKISPEKLAIEVEQYVISQEEALANLAAFMTDWDLNSRANSHQVTSVITVKSGFCGRSADSLGLNNLVYVANFGNNEGYAILAADKRIGTDVIAVIDEGNIDGDEIARTMQSSASRPLFDRYPTTGPGFVRLPEYGNELFINPNTASLYIDSIGESLVGDLIVNPSSNFDNLRDTVPDNRGVIGNFGLLSSVNYAKNRIKGFDEFRKNDSMDKIGEDCNPEAQHNIYTVTTSSPWRVLEQKEPLLHRYCQWRQRSPFNDKYPKCREYWVFGEPQNAPAGCFPLAIAKILSYFNGPKQIKNGEFVVDFSKFGYSLYDFSVEPGRTHIAELMEYIARKCKCWYFYKGTFTFPFMATSFLSDNGILNAKSKFYDFETAYEMVKNNTPTIMYAIPGEGVTKSHAWNIDGYKIKERTDTIKTYDYKILKNTRDTVITTKMVHCDFGWERGNNGYYVSDVFHLDDPNADFDSDYNPNTYHYDFFVMMVTYTKPE